MKPHNTNYNYITLQLELWDTPISNILDRTLLVVLFFSNLLLFSSNIISSNIFASFGEPG